MVYPSYRFFTALLLLTPALNAEQNPPEALIAAGHWKQARAIVEARLRDRPPDAEAYFLLSQLRFAFGDHSAPLMLAEKAVALDGSVAKYHRQVAEAIGVEAQHAGPFQEIGLARRFRKEIDRALELDPRDTQALRDLLEYYLVAPGIIGGSSHEATAVADRIAAIDAPAGFLAKARIAAFHKRPSETESLLRQAAQAQPPSYRARIELGQFYVNTEHPNLDAAENAAREARQLDRTRVDAYSILATAYADRGDFARLEESLAEASREVRDNLAPYYRAADRLLASKSDLSRAERYLRRYLEQEPEGTEPSASEAHGKLDLILKAEGHTEKEF